MVSMGNLGHFPPGIGNSDPRMLMHGSRSPQDSANGGCSFNVAEFSLGCVNGHLTKFYAALTYPVSEPQSFISFNSKKSTFDFSVCPLDSKRSTPYLIPFSDDFPYKKAPLATRPFRGAIALEDILTRGIACFADEVCVQASNVAFGAGLAKDGSILRQSGRKKGPGVIPAIRSIKLFKTTLIIALRRPPKFKVDTSVPDHRGRFKYRQGTARDFMNRQSAFSIVPEGPLGLQGEQQSFKVSECLTYRFTMLLTSKQYGQLEELLARLRFLSQDGIPRDDQVLTAHSRGLPGIGSGSNGTKTEYVPLVSILKEDRLKRQLGPIYRLASDLPRRTYALETKLDRLPFSTRFLMEGLVSHGTILQSELYDLIQVLEFRLPVNDRQTAAHILGIPAWKYDARLAESMDSIRERVLASMFTEERIRSIDTLIFKKSKFLARHRPPPVRPPYITKVYRCSITPTRLLLFPPEDDANNTVLRDYRAHSDRFLRVSFTDEDDNFYVDPVSRISDATQPLEGTLGRMRRVISQGLIVAGRRYVYLAAGTSQMRSHSCWFIHEDTTFDPPFTTKHIRDSIGIIDERVVAKYAARLGQVFSTTREIQTSEGLRVVCEAASPMQDIKRMGYNFTDGAGCCSEAVATLAAKVLGFKDGVDSRPSAIQIRMGGCKGVLAVWPWLEGDSYCIRPSMQKFQSSDTRVNVIRISRFSYAYLNRQCIVLLNDLGIGDRVFLRLMRRAISGLHQMSLRFGQGRPTPDDMARITHTAYPMKAMLNSGFHLDPCVQEVLRVLECRGLFDLKWRARIEIQHGCYLLGIPDECEVLEAGEVFCQIQNPEEEDSQPHIVEGPCIVTRAPALHPGDVRLVRAVDKPDLRHLKNVIVFSTKGARDLPSMLSGGDLDGDDFTLIWDPKLVIRRNMVPMLDQPPKAIKVPQVTDAHIKANFVDYVKNDILGQVGNAHLAMATAPGFGPQSEQCLELAEIHSTAVDFAKTGVPAQLPERLTVPRWPDFMGKEDDHSYRCNHVVGQLFRMIPNDPVFRPRSDSEVRQNVDSRLASLAVPKAILQVALRLQGQYESMLWSLLLRYRICEAEAYSGMILRNGKRRRIKDNDLKDPVCEAFAEIVRSVREEGLEAIDNIEAVLDRDAKSSLAIACYRLAYGLIEGDGVADEDGSDAATQASVSVDEQAEDAKTRNLISFAWLYRAEILALPEIAGTSEEVE